MMYNYIPVFVIILRIADGWWCPSNLNVISAYLCGNFMWWAWTTMNKLPIPIGSETRNIQLLKVFSTKLIQHLYYNRFKVWSKYIYTC